MRIEAKTESMSLIPLVAIVSMMIAIVLYLVALQIFSPPPRGMHVYLPSAYGVSEVRSETRYKDLRDIAHVARQG